jgi:hypothetical protein
MKEWAIGHQAKRIQGQGLVWLALFGSSKLWLYKQTEFIYFVFWNVAV